MNKPHVSKSIRSFISGSQTILVWTSYKWLYVFCWSIRIFKSKM